ncbi:ABC transporter permease [Frankia inefficax]|uniref:Binding-protein-dependent transport systems inner membrane component n=1 Tax=Pseudofrankia inefficax (strain DSM 45817 / CECT 9037 / DDB 130130 / EuI1c) TaxID=298654 RepID=E3J8K0_PSEI1|nr:binding-protein-dependent transport systems inner membrane component [Pseudofrankia inefficax]
MSSTAQAHAAARTGNRTAGRQGRLVRVFRRYGPAAVVLVAILAAWELATVVFGVEDYILPAPSAVVRALVDRWNGTLASATWVTLTEVLLGFAIAVAAGLVTASCLHFSRIARAALYPWLIGSQTVPVVVIAPVLAIIFGYTLTPKLILVALLCFFPIVVATLDGLAAVEPDLVRLMRTLYGSRWAIFRRVELPAALPSMFTGLRLSAAYAATAAVFGEYSGSSDGLGHVMRQAVPQLQSALVFAAIALLSAMSVALFVLVTVLERLLVGWAHEGKKVR